MHKSSKHTTILTQASYLAAVLWIETIFATGGLVRSLRRLPKQTDASRFPPLMNLMDPDILQRECEKVGFIVERTSFHDPNMDNPLDAGIGANPAGIICRKP